MAGSRYLKTFHRPTGLAATLSSRRTTLSRSERLMFDQLAFEDYKAAKNDIEGNDKINFEAIFAGNDIEGVPFFKRVFEQFENASNGHVRSVMNSGALDANIIEETGAITIDDDDK